MEEDGDVVGRGEDGKGGVRRLGAGSRRSPCMSQVVFESVGDSSHKDRHGSRSCMDLVQDAGR